MNDSRVFVGVFSTGGGELSYRVVKSFCERFRPQLDEFDLIYLDVFGGTRDPRVIPMNSVHIPKAEYLRLRAQIRGVDWEAANCILSKNGGLLRMRHGLQASVEVLYGSDPLRLNVQDGSMLIARLAFPRIGTPTRLLGINVYIVSPELPGRGVAVELAKALRIRFGEKVTRVVIQDRDWFYGDEQTPVVGVFDDGAEPVPDDELIRPSIQCLWQNGVFCKER
jgi:hypothetical protein